MSENHVIAGERWTVADAVNWIVYRVEPKDAPEPVRYRSGRFLSNNLINALAARAAGDPRSWPGLSGLLPGEAGLFDREPAQPYHYRSRVKLWMQEAALPAGRLYEQAILDREAYADARKREDEQQEQFADGLVQLNKAVSECCFPAFGRPTAGYGKYSDEPRISIPVNTIDELRNIDASGQLWMVEIQKWNWLGDKGPFFCDITFLAKDVRRIFPLAGEVPLQALPPEPEAKYSDVALALWLKEREASWPAAKPFPSEPADLEAAKAHFGPITRDKLREIRRKNTTLAWHKSGPRGPRL